MGNFTRIYDKTVPSDASMQGRGAEEIRDWKEDLQERMEIDHNFNDTGMSDDTSTSDGTHKKITLGNDTSVLVSATDDAIILYGSDVNEKTELFAMNENGAIAQITHDEGLAQSFRYSYASDTSERTYAYSSSWTDDAYMDLTITAKKNDIIFVKFSGTSFVDNAGLGSVITLNSLIRITLESGSANTILASNEAATYVKNQYSVDGDSISCQAIYQATADGDLVFRNQYKGVLTDNESFKLKDRNMIAYTMGKI